MKEGKQGFTAQQMQFISQMLNYYDKNGEDKLISDIFNSVSTQKKQGKLSNEQIKQFVKNLSPMLNDNQKKRLNDLVNDLLKIWFLTKYL